MARVLLPPTDLLAKDSSAGRRCQILYGVQYFHAHSILIVTTSHPSDDTSAFDRTLVAAHP